ncbi:MAG: hypothetical protein RLZZ204_79 [Bacteroidota bacterium]|jgi:hypothetical protein
MLVVLRVKEFPPFLWGIFISRRACLLLIMSLKTILGVIFLFSTGILRSQTFGGNAVYNFIKLPMGGQLSALGGKNVSLFSADLSLVTENPALLRKDHHGFVSSSFNHLAPFTNALQGVGAYYHQKSNTSFAVGMLHLLYGQETQTDASGNSLGNFRAYDQLLSASFAKSYGKRWHYGASLKLIHSNFGVFRSTGLAADVGLTYYDEGQKLQLGFAAKNMGTQLSTYGGKAEDLPFDLVIGITKQLEKAPLRFSVTAQRLHQFDLLYNDTLYNNENFGANSDDGVVRKIFSHFVLGTEVLLGDKLVVLAGYNVLRRNELSIKNIASGLTGFSYGLQLKLNRLHFYYARSHYQSTLVQNQFTLSVRLTPHQK